MNLVIAVFNLLPGLPLDGGWILQGIIWRLRGNYHRATQLALYSGRILALSMIGIGILGVLYSPTRDGLWLVLVGTFLLVAASIDPVVLTLERLLHGMTVNHVMHRELPAVAGRVPLQLLTKADFFRDNGFCLVVGPDHQPQGMVTEQQLLQVPWQRRAEVLVEQVMTPLREVLVVRSDDELPSVARQMIETDRWGAFVLEDNELLGVVIHSAIQHRAHLCIEQDVAAQVLCAIVTGGNVPW